MPTRDQVDRAIALMSRQSVNVAYFFSRLSDASWIEPLKQRGLFRDPPKLVTDAGGNVRAEHIWPQAEYLKRMAQGGVRPVQEQVLQIMLETGQTNNYFIHVNFAEAAVALPADLGAVWARHEAEWVKHETTLHSILAGEYGSLASVLAKGAELNAAFVLIEAVLAILPDPESEKKKHPSSEVEEYVYSVLRPSLRCPDYQYEEILNKHVPDLFAVAPLETLDLLCRLLKCYVELSLRDPDKSKPYDMTVVTRPSIEDHEQNHGHHIDHHLVTALRDDALSICRERRDQVAPIIARLESYEWDIFRRIALHILTVIEPPAMDLIELRVVNPALFDYVGVHHEYYHLIKKHFGRLSARGQETVLQWIEQGKDYSGREDLSDERKLQRRKHDQYRNLEAIREHLSGDWRERYLALQQELGEFSIPPDFHTWTGGGWIGSESPRTSAQLAELPMEGLVEFLKKWRPTGEWRAPTPEGLGQALGALVAERPTVYAEEITRFMDQNMDPTYVRHLIRGFCQAFEAEKPVPFALVLRLCKWVVEQPRSGEGQDAPEGLRDGFDADFSWVHSRREIGRLLEKLFDEKRGLPYDQRDAVWEIIQVLSDDPEPDLEYEAKYGGDNMDPFTISINTIRGKALHAAMCYAMWVCRSVVAELGQQGRTPSLRDMPEVLNILNLHLDVDRCPYAANETDRAVYGQWMPQLVHLDANWVREKLNQLFPGEHEKRGLRNAAFRTFLMYSSLPNATYEVLNSVYREEVALLKTSQVKKGSHREPDARLVEHVVILYARGLVSLGDDDLVAMLFRSAPTGLTAHAIDFIGRSLRGDGKPDGDLVARFQALWEWRMEGTDRGRALSSEELGAFGWWFSCGQFPDDWTFPYLEMALSHASIGHSNIYVFAHMSRVFKEHPQRSLRCLQLLIERNDDPWFFYPERKEGVWQILEQGLAHDDGRIRDQAEALVHRLGAKGYQRYRDLLTPAP